MWLHIGLFVLGLVLLLKGSDFFVEAASRIAKALGISEFIIGLTLVAFATSIPELASSVFASYNNYSEIILGNVIGSNIANIGLILGICVLIRSFKTDQEILKRDGLIMVFVSVLFFVFAYEKSITRLQGILFLLIYLAYVMFLIKSGMGLGTYHFRDFIRYFLNMDYLDTLQELTNGKKGQPLALRKDLAIDLMIIIASGAALFSGAKLIVDEAVWLANQLSVSQTFVGLTAVAVGTSLPEIVVSATGVKKGMGNLVIGNLIGSNIVNILLVIGASVLVNPLTIGKLTITFSAPFMIFQSALTLFFIKTDGELSRFEGLALLIMYSAFLVLSYLYGSAAIL